MPRNSSGLYTLPLGNPVIDGTIIDTNWANPTMSDIAVQLNNVLTRDGLLGPTLPMFFVDGTPALPGIAFAAANGTGMWRSSTQLGVSWAGAAKQTWAAGLSTIATRLDVSDVDSIPLVLHGTTPNNGVAIEFHSATFLRGFMGSGPATFGVGASTEVFGINAVANVVFAAGGAERMRIDTAGNVGIGTAAPGYRLHVSGPSSTAVLVQGADAVGAGIRTKTSVADFYFGAGIGSGGNSWNLIDLNAGGIERMRIDAAGNVGIGVTPAQWAPIFRALQINKTMALFATDSGNAHVANNLAYAPGDLWKLLANGNGQLYVQSPTGHAWYGTATGVAGDTVAMVERMRIDAAGNVSMTGRLTISVTANAFPLILDSTAPATTGTGGIYRNNGATVGTVGSANASGMPIGPTDFGVTSVAALVLGSGAAERMRIDAAGLVGVGKAATNAHIVNALAVSAWALIVNNDVGSGQTGSLYQNLLLNVGSNSAAGAYFTAYGVAGSIIGSVRQTASGVAFNTTSDHRLKNNVVDLTDAGDLIDQLRPRRWTWASGEPGAGFVAHEIAVVSPSTVMGEKDAVDDDGKPVYQQMTYSSPELIACMVAELKSLRQRLVAAGL